ncbi:hypothetical protein [Caballeronia humi]|uniref:Uncharacterized protein n=1 Tax=Caballeronia humi TaxID=326474 RepID=A0A158HZJ5_9BURK|nr:hypothetical protein [Caballeronia humi]SAL49785.1 hypothetical protein AWB65_04012 [Caballeronia humi]
MNVSGLTQTPTMAVQDTSPSKGVATSATPTAPASNLVSQARSSTTVTISSAARQALAEATETAAQTAKEAGGGDLQAQHLLAKKAAEKATSSM